MTGFNDSGSESLCFNTKVSYMYKCKLRTHNQISQMSGAGDSTFK